MASVGGIQFALLRAGEALADPGMALERSDRPGVNGRDYREIGDRPGGGRYMGLQGYSSASTLNSAKDNLRALVGSIVTVVDALGDSRSAVLLSVGFPDEQKAGYVVGLDGVYILRAVCDLEEV